MGKVVQIKSKSSGISQKENDMNISVKDLNKMAVKTKSIVHEKFTPGL